MLTTHALYYPNGKESRGWRRRRLSRLSWNLRWRSPT
jgi:hypothetical protein